MKTLVKQCFLVYLTLFAPALYGQTFSVVYTFGSQPNDPFQPTYPGMLVQGRDGNLYSGAWGGAYTEGATYKVTPAGELATLYSFTNGSDGSLPYGGLTLGTNGNFYGAAYSGNMGGGAPFGTVFKMSSAGELTTLYTFTDGSDSSLPLAPPIEGLDGNFYGTSCAEMCGNGGGTPGSIYKITPSGNFSVLHTCKPTDCYGPGGPLVQGMDGDFYGTSFGGGSTDGGTIFKITPEGKFTILYEFALVGTAPNGSAPNPPLFQGRDGNFYGTTSGGGLAWPGCGGVVFRITPSGKFTLVHKMDCAKESGNPFAGLIQATDGNFYGVNSGFSDFKHPCGTLFKITPAGVFSVLHWFDSTSCSPYANLVQHTNGLIYGTTFYGGDGKDPNCGQACGVVYSLDIGAAPFVTFVGQPAGQPGKTLEILGQGFTGTTAVSFNGTAASFKVISDTFLAASVPTGATSGVVTVTTPTGTLTSNKKFYVLSR